MSRREIILRELRETAQAAASYEVKLYALREDKETGELKRIRRPRMSIDSPAFLFKVSLRKGVFRVSRFAIKAAKASTPTMFKSAVKVMVVARKQWEHHGTMDSSEFLVWLKTVLGEAAYRAYAEMHAR